MDTRFNIINEQQDLTEINFLLGDNQPGERGSFKIGDFFKTSWLDGLTFKIESFGTSHNPGGLYVPTAIYFKMWKGGDDWDSAYYFRDISPGKDFLKTMEKTTNPQSGGKRKSKSRGRKYRRKTKKKGGFRKIRRIRKRSLLQKKII